MPTLLNPKHERFAQGLAQGLTADAAYVDAGYAENRHNAARLGREEHIRTRVEELQGRVAERAAVTAESLIEDLRVFADMAIATKQISAGVAALKEIAILAGVRVEKREVATRTIKDMTDDELIAIATGSSERDPAPSRH